MSNKDHPAGKEIFRGKSLCQQDDLYTCAGTRTAGAGGALGWRDAEVGVGPLPLSLPVM